MSLDKKIGIYCNGVLIGQCTAATFHDYEMTTDTEQIKDLLQSAVDNEDYERAAKIRDYLKEKYQITEI